MTALPMNGNWRSMLPDLRAAAPPGMVIDMAFDTSGPVKDSVDEVEKTVFIATGLVLLVILAFIGSFRTSMIPLVTIPLSLVGTLMFINLLGFSINIFSLLAMVLAVGLVVDSLVFLWLAFGSLDFLAGQVIGKAWMVVLALPFVQALRRRDERLGIQPA